MLGRVSGTDLIFWNGVTVCSGLVGCVGSRACVCVFWCFCSKGEWRAILCVFSEVVFKVKF